VEGISENVFRSEGKTKNVFILKISRKMIGARIEVLSEKGSLVTFSQLAKRKLIIDFRNVRIGAYKIRMSKGSWTEEFAYLKQ
jgi:hypothetical protein